MSRYVDEIAYDYIGRAVSNPAQTRQVYREAAATLGEHAEDPKNAAIVPALLGWAVRFADAADRPAAVIDFLDLLRERAEAYKQVGSPYDDMAVIAREAEIHEERTPGLPRLSITPKSVNKWTRLGDVATIQWEASDDDIEGNRIIKRAETLALWQGDKEESQAVTVDTAIIDQPVEANSRGGPRPFAVITYGSDGAVANVKVDVGQRVTVVGSYVSVLIGMSPPLADYPNARITVAASIGFFAAPSAAPVLCTEYIDDLDTDEESALIPRPSKATFLQPMQSNVVGGTAEIRFFALDGAVLLYAVQWVNNIQNEPIPLTADVAFVQVVNTGDPARFRLPFQLSM